MDLTNRSPHQNQPVLAAGDKLEDAQAAMLMVHGRGASAQDILSLSMDLDMPGFAYLAPQAAAATWYPYRFLEPVEVNEPWLSSALSQIKKVTDIIQQAGIPAERTILLGFSQGACLAAEFAARNAKRYGGLVALSGGLIGAQIDTSQYSGNLAGTPVFLGCSDVDPHIPQQRVIETAQILGTLGGDVSYKFYKGMGHTVNQDELDQVREMMSRLLKEQSNNS
jgi:phospholipase/carboxylesterase